MPFNFSQLTSDPIAALGIGLLSTNNMQQGVQQAVGLLGQSQDAELKRRMMEAQLQQMEQGKKSEFERLLDSHMAMEDSDPRKQMLRAHIEKQNTVSSMFGPVPVYDPKTGQLTYVDKSQLGGGGFLPPGAAPNETEKVAGGYADRMTEQEGRMADLARAGVDSADTWENVKENVPLIGNYLIDDQFQALRQSQNDWIRAKLRKESGAVIADKEMEAERKTYFPMPGDEESTIKQKGLSRSTARDAMVKAAGNAYRGPKAGEGAPSSAVPSMGERVAGQIYNTPKGPMKWTGTGWLPAN